MDQPYPEEGKITTSCIFFAGNEVKLAHENPCCIRGFRQDIKNRSVCFCTDTGDEIVLDPSSVIAIKMTDNSIKSSVGFELCPLTSHRIVRFLGLHWDKTKERRECHLIIDIESFYIAGIDNNEASYQELLVRYFKSWEKDCHTTIYGELQKKYDTEPPCCVLEKKLDPFFDTVSRQDFDTYFLADAQPWFNHHSPIKVNGNDKGDITAPHSEDAIEIGCNKVNLVYEPKVPEVQSRNNKRVPNSRYLNKKPNILGRHIRKQVIKQPATAAPIFIQEKSAPQVVEMCDVEHQSMVSSPSTLSPPPVMNAVESSEGTLLCQFPEGSDGVTVSFRDMSRLPQGEMLNDTNIEFGIKYILHTKPKFESSCYAFNTFFWAKLVKDSQSVNFKSERSKKDWIRSNYPYIKRWTRKVDLFSKEHIIIPINDELHWCILIIQNPRALLANKNSSEVPSNPCLYIMLDSIPESDEKRNHGIEIIRDYLELEFHDKKLKTNPNLVFVPSNIRKVSHKYNPVQKNYIDCGVYLLAFFQQYVECQPTLDQEYVIDWIKYCPSFEITKVKYLREKMINFIEKHAGPERWSRLKTFEKQRCGVTNPSKDSLVAAAKKTRSHSYCHADYVEQCKSLELRKIRERQERSRSLPPRFDQLISTKPLVLITSGNGKVSGKIH